MSFLDFASGYLPPGVYVQQQTPQVISTAVTAPSFVAFVGPARGYLIAQDALVLSTTSPTPLTHGGAISNSVVISDANNNTYPSNYFTISSAVTSSGTVVSVELTTTGAALAGRTLYVTYNYQDSNYYLPKTFTNFQQIQTAYGAAFDSSNNLVSPLTLAAQFLYANGSPTVIVLPTSDGNTTATRTGLSEAYQQLASNEDIDIIVPIPHGMGGTPQSPADSINVATDLKTFVDAQAQQGIFQIGIYGPAVGMTTGPDAIAQACSDSRMIVAWPNKLQYFNGLTNNVVNVGGWTLAAAYAGFLSSRPPQYGITKSPISGFSGIPNDVFVSMTKAYKNQLSAAGVSVLEPTQNNVLRCRQGVTTNISSVVTRQISVVRSSDYMMTRIEQTLDNSGMIGNPTTDSSPPQVQIVVQAVLDSLVTAGVILGYSGLNAVLGTTNPTVIQVTFAYRPSYELDYIVVTFNVDTTTGVITPVAA
jgi:hypothetical protein